MRVSQVRWCNGVCGFGQGSVGAGGRFAGGGRAVLLSSASGFSCHWGGEEEGTTVLGVGTEAPDAGSSLSRGGGLAVCAGGRFCGCWL